MDKFDADMVEEDLHMEFEITYKSNTTEQREIEPQVAPMKGTSTKSRTPSIVYISKFA